MQDVFFSASQDDRADPFSQARQVFISCYSSFGILLMKINIEFPERPEDIRIDELHE